jgi:uncharacterized membrane protein YeaQ/YmgE (transglycosylase-associated protein family)
VAGWVLLVCVLVGGFMAWRQRYLRRSKRPAIPSYLAGVLGGLGGSYGGRMLVQDAGGLDGEIALALLFSVAGAGIAVSLVDLLAQHRNHRPLESAGP